MLKIKWKYAYELEYDSKQILRITRLKKDIITIATCGNIWNKLFEINLPYQYSGEDGWQWSSARTTAQAGFTKDVKRSLLFADGDDLLVLVEFWNEWVTW